MSIVFKNECGACIDTPLCNKTTMYVDNCDGAVKVVDNSWCINTVACNSNIPTVPTNNCDFTNWCWYIKWFSSFEAKNNWFVADKWWILVLTVSGSGTWYSCVTSWICDITDGVKFSAWGALAAFRWAHSVYAPVVVWHCYCYWNTDFASRNEYSVSYFWIYPFSC